jgi:glucokinase
VPLKKIIEREFRKKVILDNDANAAAIGEAKFGAGRGISNFIYLTISTGIGGGLILDGKLFSGTIGGAGEVGHMVIKAGGPKCGCGRTGCLESLSSGSAMERRARELKKGHSKSKIYKLAKMNNGKISAKTIQQAAALGDRLARNILNESAYYLGVGLANLINIFAPDMICLGGGVMKTGNRFLKPVKKTAKALALSPARNHVKIARAKLKEDIGVLGAAALCMSNDR